jgi:hypothetical protein
MGWITDSFGDQVEKMVGKITETVVDENQHKARLATCENCEKYSSLNFCNECHCYMPLKTKFAVFSCPLKKW